MYDCYEHLHIWKYKTKTSSYLAFCDHAKGLTDISIPFFNPRRRLNNEPLSTISDFLNTETILHLTEKNFQKYFINSFQQGKFQIQN